MEQSQLDSDGISSPKSLGLVQQKSAVIAGVAATMLQLASLRPQAQLGPAMTFFDASDVPAISIEDYVQRLFTFMDCSIECFVLAIAYIERARHLNADFRVTKLNVHAVMLASLLIAVKVNDDLFHANSYYARVGGVGIKALFGYELQLLQMLRWRAQVSLQDFQRCCDRLVLSEARLCQLRAGSVFSGDSTSYASSRSDICLGEDDEGTSVSSEAGGCELSVSSSPLGRATGNGAQNSLLENGDSFNDRMECSFGVGGSSSPPRFPGAHVSGSAGESFVSTLLPVAKAGEDAAARTSENAEAHAAANEGLGALPLCRRPALVEAPSSGCWPRVCLRDTPAVPQEGAASGLCRPAGFSWARRSGPRFLAENRGFETRVFRQFLHLALMSAHFVAGALACTVQLGSPLALQAHWWLLTAPGAMACHRNTQSNTSVCCERVEDAQTNFPALVQWSCDRRMQSSSRNAL
ncbi:unnamed protein product [Polarella glacialis]|uniref:Cyclin n=1 Tax=Polarella glacialis TaxID=89957 RepID=A0A813GXA4_POLGL|nr:unnamed protein product [Polarella glacialis]